MSPASLVSKDLDKKSKRTDLFRAPDDLHIAYCSDIHITPSSTVTTVVETTAKELREQVLKSIAIAPAGDLF